VSIGTMYPRTVVFRGFSKSHAMTGWRVGYLSGPEDIIKEAAKVQQFTFVCAPTSFQYAALEALKPLGKELLKEYKMKRDMVYEALKDLYNVELPNGAFYLYIKYPYKGDQFMRDCVAQNLIVVPGSSFATNNTHFRMSYATDDETLQRGIAILRDIATKHI